MAAESAVATDDARVLNVRRNKVRKAGDEVKAGPVAKPKPGPKAPPAAHLESKDETKQTVSWLTKKPETEDVEESPAPEAMAEPVITQPHVPFKAFPSQLPPEPIPLAGKGLPPPPADAPGKGKANPKRAWAPNRGKQLEEYMMGAKEDGRYT